MSEKFNPSSTEKLNKENGYSLPELLCVTALIGISTAFVAPSIISQKKPFENTVSTTQQILKTENLVARANAGNPRKIESINGQITVKARRNGTCASPTGWIEDTNKRFVVPAGVLVENGTVCFDSRGNEQNGGRNFNISNEDGKVKLIKVSAIGDVNVE